MIESLPHNFAAVLAAPGFSLGLRCDEALVHEIVFLPAQTPKAPHNALAAEAARQLQAWLIDPKHIFGLPLMVQGTAFRQRVWAAISTIPRGETRSYGELAQALHSAPRAVGGACGANPYPIIVPCHRVVAKDGGLGGFARQTSGLLPDIKRWLLQHESPLPHPRPEGEGGTSSLRSPL